MLLVTYQISYSCMQGHNEYILYVKKIHFFPPIYCPPYVYVNVHQVKHPVDGNILQTTSAI